TIASRSGWFRSRRRTCTHRRLSDRFGTNHRTISRGAQSGAVAQKRPALARRSACGNHSRSSSRPPALLPPGLNLARHINSREERRLTEIGFRRLVVGLLEVYESGGDGAARAPRRPAPPFVSRYTSRNRGPGTPEC